MSLTSYYVLALIYPTHPTSATYPHSSLSILCTHPQNTSSASILHLSFRLSCKKPKTNFNKLWEMSKRSSPQFQLYCDDCMCTFVRVRRIIIGIGIGVLGSVSQSFSQSGSQPSSHSVTVAIYSFDPVSNSIGLPPIRPSSPAHRTSTSHASSIWALARGVYLLATIH